MKWLAACFVLLLTGEALAADLVAERPQRLPASRDAHLAQVLANNKGSALIVNFWASWCPPCRAEMPSLQRLSERWRDRGVSVITVAVADNPSNVEDYFWEISADLPVIDDHERVISRAWAARAIPTTVIIDRRQRIRLRGQGTIDWDASAIDRQLQTLLE